MLMTFGSFYAQVPHTGKVPLFGRSNDAELLAQLGRMGISDSDYQGPTGLVTAITDTAEARGLPAIGLWAAAPMYLQGTTNPKLSAALLKAAEPILGVELGVTELEVAGRDLERKINQALRDKPDFRKLIQGMAGQVQIDPEPEPESEPPPEPVGELPTPEEVLRDLEQYLEGLRSEQEPPAE